MDDVFADLSGGSNDEPCHDCGKTADIFVTGDLSTSDVPTPDQLDSALAAARAVDLSTASADPFMELDDPLASDGDPMAFGGGDAPNLGQLVTLLEQYPGLKITLSFG